MPEIILIDMHMNAVTVVELFKYIFSKIYDCFKINVQNRSTAGIKLNTPEVEHVEFYF